MKLLWLAGLMLVAMASPSFAQSNAVQTNDQLEGSKQQPRPDPTTLTTQNLKAEIAQLKDLLNTKIEGLDRTVLQRFELRAELDIERFKAIDKQFAERDTRVEQTARGSKLAVDAALQAAKEAVQKSESNTVKQIDQLGVIMQANSTGIDGKFADLKDRVTRAEGQGNGVALAWGVGAGVVGLLIGVAGIGLALYRGARMHA